MKFLIILLALVGVPFIMGIFQTKKYKKELLPELQQAAQSVMEKAGVDSPSVDFDHLDATISGITATPEDRNAIRQKVDDLGKKAVRAINMDGLKSHGELKIERKGSDLVVNGNFAKGTWDNKFSKVVLADGKLKKGSAYTEKGYFINPALAGMSASSTGWLSQYFALPGDRGVKVGSAVPASNETITVWGDVTERIKARVLGAASAEGLNVIPEFNIIPAKPATLNTKSVNNGVIASGIIPDNLDISGLGFAKSDTVTKDYFTDAPKAVYTDGFAAWNKDYYADHNASRGYSLEGNKLALSGFATPFDLSDWKARTEGMKLTPSYDELQIFPSSFHYPSYKRVSKISDGELKGLNEAFALNQVFFDTDSSEVVGQEVFKVDALAAAIKSVDSNVKFIIGGHADSTGNVEINRKLSKQRANAVVAALAEREIDASRFTVASFGSSKAKKQGSSASDRRVEVLVK